MSESQEIVITGWLNEIRRIGTLVDRIAESLLLLRAKRITLEEKMISHYLHAMAAGYGAIVEKSQRALAQASPELSAHWLGKLQELDLKVLDCLDELLKIIRYDLNFLEQYYEHDFHKRLTQDHRFLDEIEQIADHLTAVTANTGHERT